MKAFLNTGMSDDLEDTDSQRIADRAKKELKQDVDRIQALNQDISHINARIQSQPIIESQSFDEDAEVGYSLLEVRDVQNETLDGWTYCACNRTGPNGTFVFPERNWPGVELPIPEAPDVFKKSMLRNDTSFLQVNIGSRRIGIRRSQNCNCVNPWEFFYLTPSATCQVVSNVNVCLIRVNIQGHNTPGDDEYIKEKAKVILDALDKAAVESSATIGTGFIQTWTPFSRFQV
jgi:hypothetical protein